MDLGTQQVRFGINFVLYWLIVNVHSGEIMLGIMNADTLVADADHTIMMIMMMMIIPLIPVIVSEKLLNFLNDIALGQT